MLKSVLAIALVVCPLVGAPVAAEDPCVPDTAAAYNNLGSTGCLIGLFTVNDFAWNSVSGGNFVPIPASAVNITPLGNGGVGLGFQSDSFDITGDQRILATLFYTIDPPPPILDSFDLFLDAGSPVAPGIATVSALVCAGALFANECEGGTTGFVVVEHRGTSFDLFDNFVFPVATNIVDVQLTIDMRANGASSQIDGARQVVNTIPEPGAGVLVLLGLLGLSARAGIRRLS